MNKNALNQKLAAMGITVASKKFPIKRALEVDIERTLLDVALAIESLEDRRLLGLILSWIKVHGEMVNMKRLQKFMKEENAKWIRLFAFYGLHLGQSRWKILAQPIKAGPPLANEAINMAKKRAAFKGEEDWSKNTGFLIAKGSESIHEKYVLSPTQVAKINLMYRSRLIFGSSWRADIITSMALGATTPAEAARRSGSSYEPAYRVFKELEMAGGNARNLVNI